MILVTGATGVNGRALLNRLSANGVAARALVRNPAKAEALAALPHVEIAQGDMARPETLATALRDIDRAMLISSSDPTMLDRSGSVIPIASVAGSTTTRARGMKDHVGHHPLSTMSPESTIAAVRIWMAPINAMGDSTLCIRPATRLAP